MNSSAEVEDELVDLRLSPLFDEEGAVCAGPSTSDEVEVGPSSLEELEVRISPSKTLLVLTKSTLGIAHQLWSPVRALAAFFEHCEQEDPGHWKRTRGTTIQVPTYVPPPPSLC